MIQRECVCVGSRPSAHRNMTFSTSIKAGSQSPALLPSLSHTDVPNKDRIVWAHHPALALSLSCLLILSDTVDVSQSVSQSESILGDPPPFFPSTVFFLSPVACTFALFTFCSPPLQPCGNEHWEAKKYTLFNPSSLILHCILVLFLMAISRRI